MEIKCSHLKSNKSQIEAAEKYKIHKKWQILWLSQAVTLMFVGAGIA